VDIKTDSEVNEAVKKYEKTENYTYADYAGWETDVRYELIGGKAYAMSAPSAAHQSILLKLGTQFEIFLKEKNVEYLLLRLMSVLTEKVTKTRMLCNLM